MNIKQSTVAVAVTAALAMGMTGQASASVYAGSRVEISNLLISFTGDTNPGNEVTSFNFAVSNTADLGNAPISKSGQCDNIAASPTPACSAVSPVLQATGGAANATGSTVNRANNDFSFFGPGATDTYANALAQITTAQLVQGVPTSTNSISEIELQSTGLGQANTNVQSTTQLTFEFTVAAPGTFSIDFLADPDLYTEVDTLNLLFASAAANSGVTITLIGAGNLVRWTPDGSGTIAAQNCTGGVVCTVAADTESLNNTIGFPAGNPSSAGISDDRELILPSPDLGLSAFGLDVTGLEAGSYTLTLASTTSVNASQVVPEPGMLALLGIGLLGMGASVRRRKVS